MSRVALATRLFCAYCPTRWRCSDASATLDTERGRLPCALKPVVPVLVLLPAVTPLAPGVFLSVGDERGALLRQTTTYRVAAQVIEYGPLGDAGGLMSGETNEWGHDWSYVPGQTDGVVRDNAALTRTTLPARQHPHGVTYMGSDADERVIACR